MTSDPEFYADLPDMIGIWGHLCVADTDGRGDVHYFAHPDLNNPAADGDIKVCKSGKVRVSVGDSWVWTFPSEKDGAAVNERIQSAIEMLDGIYFAAKVPQGCECPVSADKVGVRL